MKINFTTLAQQEYQEAVFYFDDQSPDLADQFIEEIEEAVQLILSFPNAWGKAGDKQRKYILKRFPYIILYKLYEDHVIISAIAHQHRNPSYWIEREIK